MTKNEYALWLDSMKVLRELGAAWHSDWYPADPATMTPEDLLLMTDAERYWIGR